MIIATKRKTSGGGTREPKKKDIYGRFIEWIALTHEERAKMGLRFAGDFAQKYGVRPSTLSDWQKRPEFLDLKREAQILKLQLETSDVLDGLKKRCIKYGMAYDVELFLLYVEKWDRKHVLEILGEVKLGDNDIRTLVDLLPEAKQKKFYDVLTELIAEAESARVANTA
jgi:hypothetical protein